MSYTASLGGVGLGSGTIYGWEREPTGLGIGDYRTARVPLPWSDGAREAGPDLLPPRRVVFEIEVHDGRSLATGGTLAVEDAMDVLKAAWAPVRTGVVDLQVTLAQVTKVLRGRPVSCSVDLQGALFGRGRARCVFEAPTLPIQSKAYSSG